MKINIQRIYIDPENWTADINRNDNVWGPKN